MAKSEWYTLFAVVFLVFAILILAITIPNHQRELRMLKEATPANAQDTLDAPKWVGAPATLLYTASGSLILLSSIFIVISIKSRDR